MLSTMQDFPLTVAMLLRHGRTVHGSESEVVTFEGDACRRSSYAQVADRADRLAAALHGLGIVEGDRVGTFMWNTQEHLEAYFAIPAMGAVLHTLNIRLFPEQLAWIVNHAADRIVIVDDNLVPVLARVAAELGTVERFIVVGDGDASALSEAVPGVEILRYDELLAAADPSSYTWPEVDERSAMMCYTSKRRQPGASCTHTAPPSFTRSA
jgi:fatty-acyl-CoA synthase